MKTRDELLKALGDGPRNEWDIESVNWELNSDSVVVEIGGYQGRWAKAIHDLYQPHLYVFEPQDWAWKNCCEALKGTGAKVYDYALGTYSGMSVLGDYGRDGASLLKPKHEDRRDVFVRDAVQVLLNELHLTHIDLMLMNIEGYEYRLIPYLASNGILNRTDIFMVQFHKQIDDPQTVEALKILREDHYSLWFYGITLSAWKHK